MAKTDAAETRKMALTTSNKVEDFQNLIYGVYLVADADCYVDFDNPADTGSFLIKANLPYHLERVQFTKLYAIAVTTANLYILATRISG